MIASTLRIVFASVGGLLLLVLGYGLAIRQPNFGRHAFPSGARADPSRVRAHVEYLCTQAFPRNAQAEGGLEPAAAYIRTALADSGAEVTEQVYEAFGQQHRNIIARHGPASGPRIVVGAHYDAYGEFPGADDNASGVAGLLELARLLATRELGSRVELVAFSSEEPPYFGGPEMGSAVHAGSLRNENAVVRAMICLEMIGYYTEAQPYTTWPLYLIYPRSGDFVTIAGRWADRALARDLKRSFRGATSVPVVSYSGPVGLGADLSDHRNYWAAGYPAVLVTDTAFMRNPNYHSARDVPSTLDYASMAGVVDGLVSAVVRLAGARTARTPCSTAPARPCD